MIGNNCVIYGEERHVMRAIIIDDTVDLIAHSQNDRLSTESPNFKTLTFFLTLISSLNTFGSTKIHLILMCVCGGVRKMFCGYIKGIECL